MALSHPVGGTGTPHHLFWVVIARLHKEGEKPLTLVRGVSFNKIFIVLQYFLLLFYKTCQILLNV